MMVRADSGKLFSVFFSGFWWGQLKTGARLERVLLAASLVLRGVEPPTVARPRRRPGEGGGRRVIVM